MTANISAQLNWLCIWVHSLYLRAHWFSLSSLMRSHPAVSVSDRCSKVSGHNAMMSQRFRAGWGCCEAFLDIWWPTSKNASYEHTSVITTLPTSLGDLSLIRLAAVRSTKAKCPNCRLQDSRRPKQVVLNVWPRNIDQISSDLVGMSQLRCNLKGFLSTPIFTPILIIWTC